MYPYENRWTWWMRPRQRHLVDALEETPDAFEGRRGETLRRRVKGLRRWLKVRAVLVVLLSFSLVAAVVMVILNALGGPEEATAALQLANRVTGASASLFSALYILTLRTLGQLEIDAILLLPAHRP